MLSAGIQDQLHESAGRSALPVLAKRLPPMPRLLREDNQFKNLRCRDVMFGSRLQTWPTPNRVHQWLCHLH
ncbi:hypothetical protein HPB50_026637 [Hyalomma asiaticum]|uniref:Uncharacterized protein n=1 Tax=Hyalomma asiaticum TaxID=266040 RepID=A0ACB7T071_HYAAI|nr:hypothetical protein HPB50_026637 [Hyalomma asiaticum]